ncbi:MAG: nuclear transport factor 2 family protein, partial [Nocardioides sp.]|nr:nuclear transport factor 2 family protein [Nocardioides sp.]
MDPQEISDRMEITDLITRYTRAVDTRQFADLHQLFTEDAVLDYSANDGPVGPPEEAIAWVERGLAGFARCQHIIGQVAISFAEDRRTAQVTAYFTNPLVGVAPDGTETVWEVGGYYHHEMVSMPDGWRSRAMA